MPDHGSPRRPERPKRSGRALAPKRPDGRTLRARPRSTGGTRTADGAAPRRQEILDAGALLMQQRGFVGTTVEDVAGHLELTKAAFYYYVATKEELLYQIAQQTLQRTDATVSAIGRSAVPPGVKLGRIVDSFVRLVAERPEFFTVYFQEKGHLGVAHQASVTKIERKIVRTVERVYREGIAAGAFRRTDPSVAAFGILGLCFWVYKWYRPGGRRSLDEISAILQALCADGYRRSETG
ncbi:MAG TPA: TetR/AcrR family transcriptional regulator [Candidatus Limnocylindria bacterium]